MEAALASPGSATRTASTSISRSARRSRTAARPSLAFAITPRATPAARNSTMIATASASMSTDRSAVIKANFSRRATAGMPCAGSDLHRRNAARRVDPGRADPRQPPEIEGTAELPDIPTIAKRLGGRREVIPRVLPSSMPDEMRIARRGISRAGAHPAPPRPPLFIDKLPNNWAHVGLIRLILPNARIIDARRHPLACGFSNFKQHYARGQASPTTSPKSALTIREYVRLMRHFDARPARLRPPRDPRGAGRRSGSRSPRGCSIFSACRSIRLPGIPRKPRAVRTASSEQVRRPISRDGPRAMETVRAVARAAEGRARASVAGLDGHRGQLAHETDVGVRND